MWIRVRRLSIGEITMTISLNTGPCVRANAFSIVGAAMACGEGYEASEFLISVPDLARRLEIQEDHAWNLAFDLIATGLGRALSDGESGMCLIVDSKRAAAETPPRLTAMMRDDGSLDFLSELFADDEAAPAPPDRPFTALETLGAMFLTKEPANTRGMVVGFTPLRIQLNGSVAATWTSLLKVAEILPVSIDTGTNDAIKIMIAPKNGAFPRKGQYLPVMRPYEAKKAMAAANDRKVLKAIERLQKAGKNTTTARALGREAGIANGSLFLIVTRLKESKRITAVKEGRFVTYAVC